MTNECETHEVRKMYLLAMLEDHDYDRDVTLYVNVFKTQEEAEKEREDVLWEDWELAAENEHPKEVFGFRFGSFEEYKDWAIRTGRAIIEEKEMRI